MSKTDARLRDSERQSRFIEQRVAEVEKTFGQLCATFASVARKQARLRDKGDILSSHIMTYADQETVSQSLTTNLKQFSESYAAIQDYREALVKRIDVKVVSPLKGYGNTCKGLKSELGQELGLRKKERGHKTQLTKLEQKSPQNSTQIAKSELERTRTEAAKSSQTLEQAVCTFEQNRISDFKQALTDFVNIEMVFHAKALEQLSMCVESLDNIDIDQDMTLFREKLREHGGQQNDEEESDLGVTMTTMSEPDQIPLYAVPDRNRVRKDVFVTSHTGRSIYSKSDEMKRDDVANDDSADDIDDDDDLSDDDDENIYE